ncbi:MAG: NYN domain-containing protein [Bryobacterales bacterium]|nr:NYN domain-containing protein [Bryobacterales bacterium]
MQEKLNVAVFVDYDNIEIGVKSTLRREFHVAPVLDALKERGVIVAKFAYANWGRQEGATRQMAENAVQMVQRIPSPRGDKNGADINLALDALEMAFTHPHVNAFAIVSGDSDFIPLVNKLREYGKTVFIVGGKAFTSTILQQNCHEFISYEGLLDDLPAEAKRDFQPQQQQKPPRPDKYGKGERAQAAGGAVGGPPPAGAPQGAPPPQAQGPKQRPAPLDLAQAVPLVERALEVLERRAVQPQLGLLKSTMLQLNPSFSEKAYGAHSFSEFVEMLKRADFVNVTGSGGRYMIERKRSASPETPMLDPEDSLQYLRDVLENHRLDMEDGVPADQLQPWVQEEAPQLDWKRYGFQEFNELLNFAQDRTVVRIEPDEEKGLTVYLGAEFYPPAPPPAPDPDEQPHEYDERQPFVEGQPTIFEPDPKPVSPRARKRPAKTAKEGAATKKRAPRRKNPS